MLRQVSLVIAVQLLASSWGGDPTLQAQQRTQLFLSVVDDKGAPVTTLEPADLSVLEDGADCKIVKIEPISWPMKLSVLVDNGRALSNSIGILRDALRGFFAEVPESVEMSLLTLAPNPRWVVRPTSDRQKIVAGIDLISPDQGAGLFFDGLVEAGKRIEQDKSSHFPAIVMIASDVGRNGEGKDRDFQRLQTQILEHAMTIHMVMFSAGGDRAGSVAGAIQTEVGLAVTKLSGGRYDNIAATTRLSTLLPEFGKQIARSNLRQSHQFRITYERPAGAGSKGTPAIAARVSRPGLSGVLTLDGHIP